jgi:zinc transporter ZupT
MSQYFIHLILFGVLAAGGNVLGGLMLFPSGLHAHYQRFLKYLLALGAGFMLAVTFFEILPRVYTIWSRTGSDSGTSLAIPMGLVLAGYLVTQFFEHTVAPHLHLGGEMHCDQHDHALISPRSAYTTIGGLTIHTFFDGVSIAAASQIDVRAGALVFAAVLLHKLPEGFTIGSILLAAGKERRHVLTATAIVGSTTLLGVLAFAFLGSFAENAVAYALPLAGGVTLYVAASDLIPEVNHHAGKNPLVSLAVFVGVGIFFAAQAALHEVLAH